jgi:hypothetical protein
MIDETLFALHKDQPLYDSENLNPAVLEMKVKPEGSKSMSWGDFVRGYL